MVADAPIAAVANVSEAGADHDPYSVSVQSLNFIFPNGVPFLHDFSLCLPPGSRCLLLGANGAGKTTLLQILAGKFMVGKDAVRILGRPPFYDLALTCGGDLSFLGSAWRRDVACAGFDIPLQGDIGAGDMIFGVEGVDEARRDELIDLLDIDLNWRMNRVSDGQRRRVQICMGLLKPYKVLLLDEITVDMDVVGRLDLLKWFERECDTRGCVIVYATHIFDGLHSWITHLAHVSDGRLTRGGPVANIPELQHGKKLLFVVEQWLRDEREAKRAQHAVDISATKRSTPLLPSKHLAYFR